MTLGPANYRRHLISFDNLEIFSSILNVLFGNWCYLTCPGPPLSGTIKPNLHTN